MTEISEQPTFEFASDVGELFVNPFDFGLSAFRVSDIRDENRKTSHGISATPNSCHDADLRAGKKPRKTNFYGRILPNLRVLPSAEHKAGVFIDRCQ